MLRANSTFGFAPDLLGTFAKPQTGGKSPKPLPGQNQRYGNAHQAHQHDHQAVSDVVAKENSHNQGVSKPVSKPVTNDWQEFLLQIGQQFRDVRTSLGMSQYQLHYQTLVPIAHIQALETGRIEALPTAVYVRGFIRKIGTALGLDGDRLADSMPEIDPVKTVLGSQCLLPKSSHSQMVLSRMHLYLGYFALLLISSVWLKQQENATQTQLEKSAISEIQSNVSTETKPSTQL
jgi:transcriptional regulator with XRE-family HTH domain